MEQYYPIIFTQVITALAIIASNKTDIAWLKRVQELHNERITKLEEKASF